MSETFLRATAYTLCLKKTHQLRNSIAKNYKDQF